MADEFVELESRDGDRVLRGRALKSLEVQLESLLGVFRELSGEWRDGYVMEFGFGPLFLRSEDDREFAIFAPDYLSDARTDRTDDLSMSLYANVSITSTAAKAGVEVDPVTVNDDVYVVKGWSGNRYLSFERNEREDTESGWFIGPFEPDRLEEYDADELELVKAWEVLRARPSAVRPFGLPEGVTVVMDGDDIRVAMLETERRVLIEGPF